MARFARHGTRTPAEFASWRRDFIAEAYWWQTPPARGLTRLNWWANSSGSRSNEAELVANSSGSPSNEPTSPEITAPAREKAKQVIMPGVESSC